MPSGHPAPGTACGCSCRRRWQAPFSSLRPPHWPPTASRWQADADTNSPEVTRAHSRTRPLHHDPRRRHVLHARHPPLPPRPHRGARPARPARCGPAGAQRRQQTALALPARDRRREASPPRRAYQEAWWAKRKDEGISGPEDIPAGKSVRQSAMRLSGEIGDTPAIVLVCATARGRGARSPSSPPSRTCCWRPARSASAARLRRSTPSSRSVSTSCLTSPPTRRSSTACPSLSARTLRLAHPASPSPRWPPSTPGTTPRTGWRPEALAPALQPAVVDIRLHGRLQRPVEQEH